eukprot:scaffold2552_cov172-Alexandrium_tamarense.AAC.26
MNGTSSLTTETHRVVQRYDEALQQVASLTREIRKLKEELRRNQIDSLELVGQYEDELALQSEMVTNLKKERHEQDLAEQTKRQVSTRDVATWIGQSDFVSKETELENVIDLLEDEIQGLKQSSRKQRDDFQRQSIVNQAAVKHLAREDLCNEVHDVITELLMDNERLRQEFSAVLSEMEKIQVSREVQGKELARTKRELDFLRYRDKLMRQRQMQLIAEDASRNADTSKDTSNNDKADEAISDSLEEYFTQCFKNSQR